MNKTLCVLEFDLSLEMHIQAARTALRLFIKAKLSSKGITEALECTKPSSQILVNVAKNLSTISTSSVQPVRHFVRGHLFLLHLNPVCTACPLTTLTNLLTWQLHTEDPLLE